MTPTTARSDPRPFSPRARRTIRPRSKPLVVYTIDVHSVPGQPFGRETFSRREDAERYVADVSRGAPDIEIDLQIEERELVAA
jgi:hypothetical protein